MSLTPELARAKILRTIITIGLSLCLLAIVAGYIYYGMQVAKNPPVDTVVETSEIPEMTPSAAEIFTALEAAPVTSPENITAVVEALTRSESAASAEERESILDALGYPASQ